MALQTMIAWDSFQEAGWQEEQAGEYAD